MDGTRAAVTLALTLALLGCGPRARTPSATDDACSQARRRANGGELLRTSDGAEVWYKRAGQTGETAILFVHGGPGYNALTFEESSGRLLERRWPVLYVDQRGCGRSSGLHAEQLGMARTVADLEAIRAHTGFPRVALIGHSFGGAVAAEYARLHPTRVAALIMVDTTPDLHRALAYQVAHIDAVADARFPAQAEAVHAIARAPGTPFTKLGRLYGARGRLPLQGELHYADARTQDTMERIDEASGYLRCTDGAVVGSFEKDGYLSERKSEIAVPLPAPSLLVAGTASHVIGADNIRDAAALWGARLAWIDAGHFVYFERPQSFVATTEAFLREVEAR